MTQHQKARAVGTAGVAAEAAAPAASRRRGVRWRAVRQTASLYALVALGSMIGGVLRAIASLGIHAHMEPGFAWGTLFVNVTGSFAIGFYATLTGPEGRVLAGSRQRQFIMTGICGGYTTFSVFSLETFHLLHAGDLPSAGLNVGIAVVCWMAAVWLGHRLAMGLNRLKGS